MNRTELDSLIFIRTSPVLVAKKTLTSEQVDSQIEAFLARGGKIKTIPVGVTGLRDTRYITGTIARDKMAVGNHKRIKRKPGRKA